jgi:autotransporter-associated beta strand protein
MKRATSNPTTASEKVTSDGNTTKLRAGTSGWAGRARAVASHAQSRIKEGSTKSRLFVISGVVIAILGVVSLFAPQRTSAAAKTWVGTTTDWGTASNWSSSGVPTSADDVTIPTSPTGGNFPTISSGNGTVVVKSLTISSGATVNQTGGTLQVASFYANATTGTFNATGGTIQFTTANGGGSTKFIGTNQFFDVIVDAGIDPKFGQVTSSSILISHNFTNNNTTLNTGTNATFTFNGTGAQSISSASTGNNATFGNLVINNTGGTVSLSTDVTAVAGTLTVKAGSVLDLSTHAFANSAANGPTTLTMEIGSPGASITGSTGTLTLGGDVTVNATTGSSGASISCPVALGAARTFTVADDGTTASDLSIGGVISGATFGITKAGAGTLTLSGANTYSGTTTVITGTAAIGNDAAFGTGGLTLGGTSANSPTILASGGSRAISNNVTLAAVTTGNATIGGSNDLTFGGSVTNNGGSRTLAINNAGTTTFGTVNLSENNTVRTLTITGTGKPTFGGVIQNNGNGAQNLTFDGSFSGTATINGTNTYSGATTLSSGTFVLGNKAAFGTATVAVNGVSISANTDLSGANAIANTITNGGNNTFTGSNNIEFSGTWTDTSSRTLTNNMSAGALTLSGGVNLSNSASNFTLTFNGSGNTLVSSVVANGGTSSASLLTYSGTGTLTLSGANSYAGITTISSGTVSINSLLNVGGGSSSLGAPTTVANGTIAIGATGILKYTGSGHSSDRVINLTASGGSIDASGSGTFTLIGGVTGNTFNLVLTGTGAGVESGVIATTSGTVTKNGAGTWTLSGTNTFTGGATLNVGTLNINSSQALGTSLGTFTIAGGTIDNTSGADITTVNYQLALNADFTYAGSVPRNLNLGTAAVTFSANRQITVTAGTLTIGGTISAGTRNLTKAGAGTLSFGSNTVTLNSLTISAGTLTSTSGTMNLAGDFTNNATFTHNSGTVTFNGSAATQTISGSTTTPFSTLTIANTSFAIAANTNFSVAATLTVNASAVLSPAAAVVVSGGGTLTGSGTVRVTRTAATADFASQYTITNKTLTNLIIEYTGTAAQSISGGLTYGNLMISNTSATVSASSNFGVSGTLTVNANAIFSPAAAVVINSGGAAGTITGSGTIQVTRTASTADYLNQYKFTTNTLSSMTVDYAGSSAQTINSSGISYGGLKSSGGGLKTLDGSVTVNNALTLTSGKIDTTTSFTLTLASGATSTAGSTTSYVMGNLKKVSVPSTFTFAVGYSAANAYTPVDLANSSGGGDLTVAPKTPNLPALNSAKSLQEYWTLTLSNSLTTDVTFNYLQGDVMGTESNYRIIKKEGSNITTFPNDGTHVIIDTTNNKATLHAVNAFSDWTLGEPQAATVVRLTSFSAIHQKGDVMIQWQSGFEADNLGYNLYRQVTIGKRGRTEQPLQWKRERVTPSLIAGSALLTAGHTVMTAGQAYTWYDRVPEGASVTYWLEDIDLNGTRTMHGPYVARSGAFTRSQTKQSLLLNQLNPTGTSNGIQIARGASSSAQFGTHNPGPTNGADPAKQQQIANMAAVKLSVRKDGWYRVSQADLVAAGLDANVDASRLQLYVNGREVPIEVSGNQHQFTAADSIQFYGRGLDTATTDTQVYYLIAGSSSGKRVSHYQTVIDPNAGPGPQTFSYTVQRQEKLIYFAALDNGDAENFFGQVVADTPLSETLAVTHIDSAATATQGAQLEVALQGLTVQAHQVRVLFNGVEVGTMSFADKTHAVQSFLLSSAPIFEGNNTVQLLSLAGGADVSLVDRLRVSYAHTFAAENNALSVSANPEAPVSVTGFTGNNIRVLDVSDARNVQEITPVIQTQGDGTFTATVQVLPAADSSTRTLMIFTDNLAATADAVTRNEPSHWGQGADGADMVIVTHRDFFDNVEPLADLRRSQGLTVNVIDVEDLFDEFSYGAHTPQAIKDFLAATQNKWEVKPRYVLLVGDASYDPKNYLGQGINDLTPTKLLYAGLLKTASDGWFVDFHNDAIDDLAIGRLPVRTTGEAANVVAKIISYENTAPDPTRGAILVADRTFESANTTLQPLLPSGMPVQIINRSSSDDTTIHNQIISGLNQGPRLVNYTGHGSNGVWTSAPLLSSPDAAALTNDRLSLFVMMTCLNGFFQDAYSDSLAEALMKAPNGAVAVWASSGMTEPDSQSLMDQEFYRQLFGGQSPTLGDATRAAKAATNDLDVRRTWLLIGDPAMKVR